MKMNGSLPTSPKRPIDTRMYEQSQLNANLGKDHHLRSDQFTAKYRLLLISIYCCLQGFLFKSSSPDPRVEKDEVQYLYLRLEMVDMQLTRVPLMGL